MAKTGVGGRFRGRDGRLYEVVDDGGGCLGCLGVLIVAAIVLIVDGHDLLQLLLYVEWPVAGIGGIVIIPVAVIVALGALIGSAMARRKEVREPQTSRWAAFARLPGLYWRAIAVGLGWCLFAGSTWVVWHFNTSGSGWPWGYELLGIIGAPVLGAAVFMLVAGVAD